LIEEARGMICGGGRRWLPWRLNSDRGAPALAKEEREANDAAILSGEIGKTEKKKEVEEIEIIIIYF
jgi:hypothetical protein